MADKETKVIITGNGKAAEQALKDVGKAAQKAGDQVADAGKKMQDVTKDADKMGQAMSVLASSNVAESIMGIAGSIGQFGLGCIKAAAQMRQYEIAFQTMLKDTAKGSALLKDLQKFAADTPFDVPGVVQAGQQLMAMGFAADSVVDTLTVLGDAAAGLGRGSEGVKTLAYALGQINSSGTLKTQDIMQLTNAGIDAWGMLADAAGVSVERIKDAVSRGQVDSLAAIDVLTAGIQNRFGGMMANTSREITGLTSNIEENVGNTAVVVGDMLIKAFDIKGRLATVSNALDNFQRSLQQAANKGKNFGEIIRDTCPPAVIAGLGALAAVFGGVLVTSIMAAVAAMATFIGLSAPVVGALAAVGAVIGLVVTCWDDMSAGVEATWNVVKTVAGDIYDAVADMFEGIIGFTPEWVTSVKGWLVDLLREFKGWAADVWQSVKDVFSISGGDVKGSSVENTTTTNTVKRTTLTFNDDGGIQRHRQLNTEKLRSDEEYMSAFRELQTAMRSGSHEEFLGLLNNEQSAQMLAMQEEQTMRQQLFDWKVESLMSYQQMAMESLDVLKNGLAEGIANLITSGGKLSDVFKNVGKSIVAMFAQFLVKKAAATVTSIALGRAESKAAASAAAAATPAMAGLAVQKSISMLGPIKGAAAYAAAVPAMMGLGSSTAATAGLSFGSDNSISFAGISGYANGGIAEGWAMVGERGPELVDFRSPARVYTAQETASMLSNARMVGADGSIVVNATLNNYGDINNSGDLADIMDEFSAAILSGLRTA